MGLIESKPVQRRRPREEDSTQTRSSFIFHVLLGSRRVRVCEQAFLNLYALSGKSVYCLMSLILQGKTLLDNRGKHVNCDNAVPKQQFVK
ncbi:hypothetical protein ANN_28078 [Periplaneta americana]|uniref:Uncharacterized protein n=1 Tax=Periplaneta americana TaxID=6978 RepID=A0ABQ8RUW5_PERAM|nr:hypothetical protein ANN_28078 [Periplaneta americana]